MCSVDGLVELLVGERTTPPSRVSREGGMYSHKIVRIKIKTKYKTPLSHFSSEGGVVTLSNAGNCYLGDQSIRRERKRRKERYTLYT